MNTTTVPVVHHVLAGSFRSLSLFLLAFSPAHRTLSLVQRVDAFGPHQYIATSPRKDRAYATSWSLPPVLSSWEVQRSDDGGPWRVHHINNVPITATSSYISLPPPYTHAYSVGGPTGEVHLLEDDNSKSAGALGPKIQEILFVPAHELPEADKTRAALRYGSHGIEFSTHHAFVPVLGTNIIEMYTRDRSTGILRHVASLPSPRGPSAQDGPRHVKVHPNGKVLYCVTEHSNMVDAYTITPTSLVHLASRSLLPPHLRSETHSYRGDTLMLTPPSPAYPSPRTLFATTRGSTSSYRGYLSVFALDADGLFVDTGDENSSYYYQTPTSGGKANAIDVLHKTLDGGGEVWLLLTDDDDAAVEGGGGVRVLEWDGWGQDGGVKEVAGWSGEDEQEREDVWMEGGSHAVWLD